MPRLRFACFLSALTAIAVLVLPSPGHGQAPAPPQYPAINAAAARLEQTFNGLDGPGFAIGASDAAGMVAAACDLSTIQLWNKDTLYGIRAGNNSANVLAGHEGTVTALAWNGGPVLASSAADKKIMLWEVASGKVLHTLPVTHLVRTLAMSDDGKYLASGGDENVIRLWDVAAGKEVRQFAGHNDWVLCLDFSQDGKFLASGGYDGAAFQWDVASGNKVRDLPTDPKQNLPNNLAAPFTATEIAFSPDGKQIVIGRGNGIIDQINGENGQRIRVITGHTSCITGLAYHPTGSVLVSSSKDGTLRLWNPPNGAAIKALDNHKAWVLDVVFFAQGTRLASVGADRTVRVWNLMNP